MPLDTPNTTPNSPAEATPDQQDSIVAHLRFSRSPLAREAYSKLCANAALRGVPPDALLRDILTKTLGPTYEVLAA